MKKLAAWLGLTVSALFACAETYNGVEYSTSGNIVPGEMTSQFVKALAYADAKNIPLVVVWANPGCGYCAYLEASGLAKPSVKKWLATRKYVFVFCLGTTTSDGSEAWKYTYTKAYPMCRVHWRRNTKGQAVDYTFVGRSGQMHSSVSFEQDIDAQFMRTVDLFCGDYSGGSTPSDSWEPDVPAAPPSGGKYVLNVTASGNGTVSGGGSYKPGTSVYLRASAKSGSVFAGWYSGSTLLAQTTSFSYRTTAANVSIVGKFIAKSADAVQLTCSFASQYTKGVTITPVQIAATGNSLTSVKVSGLPTGLSYKNGAVGGRPTRSGVYVTTVSAKTTGGAIVTKTFTIVVNAFGEYYVKVPCDATIGTVSGQGVYAAGRTVTLKMSAKKGNVFAGWYNGSKLLSKSPTYRFTMPSGNLTLTPEFITAEEDLAAISLVFDDYSMDAATPLSKSVVCGVKQSWDVISGGLSETKVEFAGLPSGLTYNAGTSKIEGSPTAARDATIRARVTTSGGNSKIFVVQLKVSELPIWARGTFHGWSASGKSCGRATLSISASGVVSGKLCPTGTTHPLTAASLDSDTNGDFTLSPVSAYSYISGTRIVKAEQKFKLKLSRVGELGRISGTSLDGISMELLQSPWDRNDLRPPKFISGTRAPIVTLSNGIKLKIGPKGEAKIGGKIGSTSVSGDSQLVAGYSDGMLSPEAQAVLSISRQTATSKHYYGQIVDLLISDRDGDGLIDTVIEDPE